MASILEEIEIKKCEKFSKIKNLDNTTFTPEATSCNTTIIKPENYIEQNNLKNSSDVQKVEENLVGIISETSEKPECDITQIHKTNLSETNTNMKASESFINATPKSPLVLDNILVLKKKNSPNMSINPESRPELYVPFDHGWKRQVVYRSCNSTSKRADIYYYSPNGHKCRSNPDVLKYLNDNNIKNVSIENFSFLPKPIYKEPFEEVRQALKRSIGETSTPSPKFKKEKAIKPNQAYSFSSTPTKVCSVINKMKFHNSSLRCRKIKKENQNNSSTKPFKLFPNSPSSPKTKTVKNILYKSKKVYKKDPRLAITQKQNKSILDINSSEQRDINGVYICSLICQNVESIVPSLPCSYCLTLYHPSCVKDLLSGQQTDDNDKLFLCRPCLNEAIKANPLFTNENILFLKKEALDFLLKRNKSSFKMTKLGNVPSPMSFVRIRGLNRVAGVPLLKHGLSQQAVYPRNLKESISLPPLVRFSTSI